MLSSDPNIFRAILDSLQIGVYLLDRTRRIVFWNRGAERITGYQRHEVVGHLCQENILPDCGDHGCGLCGAACPLALTTHEGKAKEANVYFRHHEGHKTAMQVWAVPVRDENGTVIGVAESFYESKSAAARNRRGMLAAHGCLDPITGVGNPDFTLFHLRESLASYHEYRLPFGVVSLRINNLEYFKAAYGRLAEDEVMNLIAESARNGIRPTDFVGRLSEGQFLVIALNCSHTGLEKVLHRIQKVTNHMELKWWGDKLEISLSIGVASVQGDDTPESILARAGIIKKENAKATASGAES
ncbi:MAG TPA: diguanylate cyclase [Terriglobales bacterium]|jgi:diguanylate cyclase (GGDEF)-like protein/PAS domain S-box-containing protein